MKPTIIIGAAVFVATVAIAAPQNDSSQTALELGTVLAAEEFCGLKYDHEKIAAFIEREVPANDMGFASMLQLMTAGKQYDVKRMTGAAKAAHCAQIKRVAKANEFVL